jgi:ATP-dependent helicase HrpB
MDVLPIDEFLPDIIAAVRSSAVTLIAAEPGAGKTTRVPPALLDLCANKILVLQPRRLAAKTPALYLRRFLGFTVGYQVRYESDVRNDSRLIFMTEGLLQRRLAASPLLDDIDIVVMDEFHERHLTTDAVLMMLRPLLEKGRLKLVIMSATFDIQSLQQYFPEAQSFQIPGRAFPIDVEYRAPQKDRSPTTSEICEAIRIITKDPRCQGSVLVFLPGRREIESVQQALVGTLPLDIFPLFADLSTDQQQRVFQLPEQRKVILATNVAETSVTIPGVTGVVDSGLVRQAAFSPYRITKTLDLRFVSQASAAQRAGRAGRESHGLVYRLYRQQDLLGSEKFTTPEISRSDLSALRLDLASFSDLHGDQSWCWLDQPPVELWESARSTLRFLAAEDDHGQITNTGRDMVKLALEPRMSRIFAEAKSDHEQCLAAMIGAVLSEPPRQHPDLLHLLASAASGPTLRAFKQLAPQASWDSRNIDHETLTRLLLKGFGDRLARKQNHRDYQLSFGGVAQFQGQEEIHQSEWIIVLSATMRQQKFVIEIAAGVTKDELLRWIKTETRMLETFENSRVQIWEAKCIGQLILEQKRVQAGGGSLVERLLRDFPQPFGGSEDIDVYHHRRTCLDKAKIAHDLPVFEGEMLELLIHAIAENKRSYQEITERRLQDYIEEQLDWDSRQVLQKMTPLSLVLANKKNLSVDYTQHGQPIIRGYVQDFYGCSKSLQICDGRIDLSIEMLGPNKRPVARFVDLPGFWKGTYLEIKKELSRRYPRHHWAEVPEKAPPVLHRHRL